MSRRVAHRSEAGFTLPELLVAITILGIIVVAIGAMITTSFRTSATVSAELQGSRGPKVVSRYWVPDAEQATGFPSGGGCGPAGQPIATFTSPMYPSAFTDPANPDPQTVPTRTITWSVTANGQRSQLVRFVCDGRAQPLRTVVVSDLEGLPNTSKSDPPRQYVLTVSVPDRSRSDNVYTFDVAGSPQVTTTTSAP